MTDTRTISRSSTRVVERNKGWTDDELAAMKAHAQELKTAARRGGAEVDGEAEVRAKIAELPEPDRALAKRIHALVTATAPSLAARTYYGMPAYAQDGKVVCFFRPASKFKERYAIFGFEQKARLDEGTMWPTSFALTELTPAAEARIVELVTKAVG
jgi:uncharacterized protein YdhG (YjbR/CyaY superfamily)